VGDKMNWLFCPFRLTARTVALTLLALLISMSTAARADTVLGLVGVEPGTPIVGEEDIVIYNNTGLVSGCSTPSGTPICTPVTFADTELTINGSIHLLLGDIAPGYVETDLDAGGVFAAGSITSLSLTTTLSTSVLTNDMGVTVTVDPDVAIASVPTGGSLFLISVASEPVSVPEPFLTPLLVILCVLPMLCKSRQRIRNSVQAS
jgi:hypothetical protein